MNNLDTLLTKKEFSKAFAEIQMSFSSNHEKHKTRAKEVDERFQKVDESFVDIDGHFVGIAKTFKELRTYMDQRFDSIERRMDEEMYTKKDHAKFMEWMDEAMTEVRASRMEREMGTVQRLRMDDQLADHEKRITALEE